MLKVTVKEEKQVHYLKCEIGVLYWEDSEVNGKEDTNGDLIPLRKEETWNPVIRLDIGKIIGWPKGTTANIHYKVCDAGVYTLMDLSHEDVVSIDGYVPNMLCPEGGGYGDYVIMKVDENGIIDKFIVDLECFEQNE